MNSIKSKVTERWLFVFYIYDIRIGQKNISLTMNYINITFKDFINQQLNEVVLANPQIDKSAPTKTEDFSNLSWKEIREKFNQILDDNDDISK